MSTPYREISVATVPDSDMLEIIVASDATEPLCTIGLTVAQARELAQTLRELALLAEKVQHARN